jgi:putative FmdB family regulatory protein
MPYYEYKCLSCQECFEEFNEIQKRKKPESKPCPKCGASRVKQVILTSPNIGTDSNIDIHKATGGFKAAMQKVVDSPGIKGSKRATELKDRYNL